MPTRKTRALTQKRTPQGRAFGRTRENMSEFGRAGAANKLFRNAFREVLIHVADRYISGRLTKRMLRILHTDPVSSRGARIITPVALPMLEGFNFNRDTALGDTLYAPYHISFNYVTCLAGIHLPFFNTATMVNTLSNADSFSIIGCAAAIDFVGQETEFVQQQTDFITFTSFHPASIHFALQLPPGNKHPVIIAIGVMFPDDKKFNAMAVVKVFSG